MTFPRPFAALLLAATMLLLPAAAQAASQTHPVLVRVLASGGWKALPVVDAKLVVSQGGKVVARGRTGSRGMGMLRAPRGKGSLRVVAVGGEIAGRRFGGTMAAELRRYRWPATIHVDSVTTLASRYRRAHPRLSAAKTNARTKRFLKLPAGYVIGRDGASNAPFDGRRFLSAAGTGRTYNRFVGRLAHRIGKPKAHRSFAFTTAQPGLSRGAVAQSVVEDGSQLEEVTKDIAKGEGFFSMLEKGNQVLDFVHVALQLAGVQSGQATAAEIRELSSQLQQVEQSIGVVQATEEELRGIALNAQYSQAVREARQPRMATMSAEDTLHSAAELSLQEGCVPPPEPITPACELIRQMFTGPGGFSAGLREGGLSVPSQVNSFAELIGGSALPNTPGNEQGIVQYGSALTTYGTHQVFYTTEDSEILQSLGAFWTSVYTESLAVVSLNWGLEGVGADTLHNDVEQLQEMAAGFPKLMPSAVPAGTAIDMVHGRMWPTEATGMGTSHPYSWFEENGPWTLPQSREWTSLPNPGTSFGAWITESAPVLPFNWTVAGKNQIDELLNGVTPASGQLAGEAVAAQTGMSMYVLTPGYEFGGRGLEMEYEIAHGGGGENSGCRDPRPGSCFWPIWVADGGTVTNFHASSGTYHYTDGTFEVPFYDVEWSGHALWGYDNKGTIYGNAPENNIPVLFSRAIGGGECYFLPAPNQPTGGSPGCP